MKRILLTTLSLVAVAASGVADDSLTLHFAPPEGKSNGKKIVLVSGDEEYRTEESCPMLAKILSQRHGFDCTVVFAINPETGRIDSNYQKNIPGLEALDSADLMLTGTRFRQLPDDQLAHFASYLNAGKPVIGIRTATHAFAGGAKTGDFAWAKFGLNILGEEWVNHHGNHKVEGTRGVIETANATHPILNSVRDVFVPTDVYGIAHLDQNAATVLLRGAVTESLDPASKAVAGPKNNPMMPVAWIREYTSPDGKAKGQAFCTTMGASVDFANEDMRRLIVNTAYFLTGQKVPDKTDVTFVDPFKPTFYSGNSDEFWKERALQPSDFGMGKDTSTGTPQELKDGQKKTTSAAAPALSGPENGERIVLVGNGLAERDAYYSRLETELQLRYPEQQLIIRNMARPGDTAGFRPHPSRKSQWAFPGAEKFHPDLQAHHGIGFFPTPDEWLTNLKADTVVGFFGYNESFAGPDGVANFAAELQAWVDHSKQQKYNGKAAPRLVLVSPIAFEDLSGKKHLPDGKEENANLALYTEAMQKVAAANGVTFIDLFHPTADLYKKGQSLTLNGFAPTDAGYKALAPLFANGLFGYKSIESKADPELVHTAVKEKDWCWNNDYNILNGVHAYGQRYEPYGPQNYPAEIAKTREMTVIRDGLIHESARSERKDVTPDDSRTAALPAVPTNFNRPIQYLEVDKALESFTMEQGFKIDLFASEKEFPDLKNPVQMSFDNKGRLWVAVMPTYPAWVPGGPMPNDKLLILEDTDGDGRADKQTIFADHLNLPIGFEFAPEGVYLSQEPNLCLLVDDDHDDHADRMEIILGGFDTHDTHHAISAYCADASGAFYLCEGRFLHSQVETSYGPQRVNDGGVWRYQPQTQRLERFSQSDYNNPWGISFNHWQQCFISDASGGNNWWALPLSAKMPYDIEIPKVEEFAPKRSRPTSGAEFVSSRHFPDEHQGDFMLCNSIGFLGTSFHKIQEEGAGYVGKHTGDLLSSNDPNFRPVDIETAPDGSLYMVDWHNALIGHMQHNARDPNRDHDHGRIYRITYPSRPLVQPAKVAGATIPELLENLKLPEYRTRYRTRRELRGRPVGEVLPAVRAWAAGLDKADPGYEHHLCEALWVTWGLQEVDTDILTKCLNAKDHNARAAAADVLRFAFREIPQGTELLLKAAGDEHPRVRLEAIVASSWMDNSAGVTVMLEALKKDLDRWMGPETEYVLTYTLKDNIEALQAAGRLDLSGNPKAADILAGKLKIAAAPPSAEEKSYGPTAKLSPDDLKVYQLGKSVFSRDAHCITCHQPNGQGLPGIYPSLAKSEWVTGDETRLIKIALKGLWGPMELHGQKFDPSKGVPPMTGFGGMLKDDELAAALSYVRQSFGNDAPLVKPETVKQVREATKDRVNFYMVDEILKEHPLTGK